MTIYLYVKQHSVTGLKYFGKTTQNDPYKYKGSGLYWSNHIKKHGNFIETVDLWGFDNQEMCTEFALTFSKNNDIVESEEWANLQEENGLDGGAKGRTFSAETRAKLSLAAKGNKANKGKTHSEETKTKMSLANKGKTSGFKGKTCSAETRAKMSLAKKGKTSGNKGKTHSAETRMKMGIAQKRRQKVNHALILTWYMA